MTPVLVLDTRKSTQKELDMISTRYRSRKAAVCLSKAALNGFKFVFFWGGFEGGKQLNRSKASHKEDTAWVYLAIRNGSADDNRVFYRFEGRLDRREMNFRVNSVR